MPLYRLTHKGSKEPEKTSAGHIHEKMWNMACQRCDTCCVTVSDEASRFGCLVIVQGRPLMGFFMEQDASYSLTCPQY